MIEINIDNTGDNEDLVIQAIKKEIKMLLWTICSFGTGTSSMINTAKASGSVAISAYGATPVTAQKTE
jgi:hypothetical protein